MKENIREKLINMSDEKYMKFSSALIPGTDNMLGVRLPQLRNLAKSIVKGNWEEAIDNTEDIYFEEIMLRGMVIGYGTSRDNDIEKAIKYISDFIPMISNWSVCDSCCVSFEIIKRNKERIWEFIQQYIYSDKEFEVRVGLIILLNHFLKCDDNGNKIIRKRKVVLEDIEDNSKDNSGKYIDMILEAVNRNIYQGYYAQMAAAWLVAEAFLVYPSTTMKFLCECNMDKFTYNKAIQKICESKTPQEEVKTIIKKMKIK